MAFSFVIVFSLKLKADENLISRENIEAIRERLDSTDSEKQIDGILLAERELVFYEKKRDSNAAVYDARINEIKTILADFRSQTKSPEFKQYLSNIIGNTKTISTQKEVAEIDINQYKDAGTLARSLDALTNENENLAKIFEASLEALKKWPQSKELLRLLLKIKTLNKDENAIGMEVLYKYLIESKDQQLHRELMWSLMAESSYQGDGTLLSKACDLANEEFSKADSDTKQYIAAFLSNYKNYINNHPELAEKILYSALNDPVSSTRDELASLYSNLDLRKQKKISLKDLYKNGRLHNSAMYLYNIELLKNPTPEELKTLEEFKNSNDIKKQEIYLSYLIYSNKINDSDYPFIKELFLKQTGAIEPDDNNISLVAKLLKDQSIPWKMRHSYLLNIPGTVFNKYSKQICEDAPHLQIDKKTEDHFNKWIKEYCKLSIETKTPEETFNSVDLSVFNDISIPPLLTIHPSLSDYIVNCLNDNGCKNKNKARILVLFSQSHPLYFDSIQGKNTALAQLKDKDPLIVRTSLEYLQGYTSQLSLQDYSLINDLSKHKDPRIAATASAILVERFPSISKPNNKRHLKNIQEVLKLDISDEERENFAYRISGPFIKENPTLSLLNNSDSKTKESDPCQLFCKTAKNVIEAAQKNKTLTFSYENTNVYSQTIHMMVRNLTETASTLGCSGITPPSKEKDLTNPAKSAEDITVSSLYFTQFQNQYLLRTSENLAWNTKELSHIQKNSELLIAALKDNQDSGASGSLMNSYGYLSTLLNVPSGLNANLQKEVQTQVEFLQNAKKLFITPFTVPYHFRGSSMNLQLTERAASARAPLFYYVLYKNDTDKNRKADNRNLLITALENYVDKYWNDLTAQLLRDSTHLNEDYDKLAPYYFWPTLPYVTQALKDLQKDRELDLKDQNKIEILMGRVQDKLLNMSQADGNFPHSGGLPPREGFYANSYIYDNVLAAMSLLNTGRCGDSALKLQLPEERKSPFSDTSKAATKH